MGADKRTTSGLYAKLQALGVAPHAAQNNANHRSDTDCRTTLHPGYAISQRIRKQIEEGFGWMKTYGRMRKPRYVGNQRVAWAFSSQDCPEFRSAIFEPALGIGK